MIGGASRYPSSPDDLMRHYAFSYDLNPNSLSLGLCGPPIHVTAQAGPQATRSDFRCVSTCDCLIDLHSVGLPV